MKTKAEAKRVAKEFQTRYLDFYTHLQSDMEVYVEDKDVIIRSLIKDTFYCVDMVATFLNGMRVSWIISVDDEGYIYARAF